MDKYTEQELALSVGPEDVRGVMMCCKGARAFLAGHGVSWQEFLSGDVTAGWLLSLDDEMARRVAEARIEAFREGGA